jgi:hypothetical protein
MRASSVSLAGKAMEHFEDMVQMYYKLLIDSLKFIINWKSRFDFKF